LSLDPTDAVTAGVMAGEDVHAELLESIVTVARAFFDAKAASITLLDADAGELVFEAVSGEGSDTLPGTRFPSDSGVAGFVASAGQSLVLDDVSKDPRFARDVAEGTGYVPKALIAAPLMRGEQVLGVLSVLDRNDESRFGLKQMGLLELFAHQAACAVSVVQAARNARGSLAGDGEMAAISRLASNLAGEDESRRAAALRLIEALADLTEPA
jgi:signal transduction protein with GAF and PtsI domain